MSDLPTLKSGPRKPIPALYGLFESADGIHWTRVRVSGHSTRTGQTEVYGLTGAYPKKRAVQIFQNALLAPYLGGTTNRRELRVVGHEISWLYLKTAQMTRYPGFEFIANAGTAI